MKMSLNVLNHLGFNLYSNTPAVLSEVVANAYDADATRVDINISGTEIEIVDDGHGMTLEDINEKFLFVGYQRRNNNEEKSPLYKRDVMGRKGIGKLSLFSIANNIRIFTTKFNEETNIQEKNGFILNRFDIETEIKQKNGVYNPKDIDPSTFEISKGTRIIISDFKKNITHTKTYLKKRLARRFSVIGISNSFEVFIDNDPITIQDRDFFKKIQQMWIIGEDTEEITKNFSFERLNYLDGEVDNSKGYNIQGWIGAVSEAGDLNIDNVNNNKISIVCRGKMAQEDILDTFNEGGIYATYLIGEIRADFLDTNEDEDIATSSRQKINEDDPRYQLLQGHIYTLLKTIQKVWTNLRREISEEKAVASAESFNPALKEWFDSLITDRRKNHAIKLFATIENLHFDKNEGREKKKELYKQGILAFEKLKLRDSLHELEKMQSPEDFQLASVFTDLSDIEANLYYDIASERVAVIKEFQRQLDANDKEKLLQKYLFNNLWLLNPSWERPTEGSVVMEQRVEKEFNKAVDTLTPEEKAGRMDIKYRTAGGKHIIVELKRYNPTYSVDVFALQKQANKYKEALTKCLATIGQEHEPIEILIVLGQQVKGLPLKQAEDTLRILNTRVIYYDYLIEQSLNSYKEYLDRHKEAGRIKNIIDKM